MKYSFMTKTSFLALCVAALTPFYLFAGGGENDPKENKPARVVAPIAPGGVVAGEENGEPNQETPAAAVASSLGGEEDLPSYEDTIGVAKAVTDFKDSKSDSDDEETAELKRQVEKQERASRSAAKKRELSERLAALKAQENEDIIAATEALEANSEGAQGKAATVDGTRAQIAQIEEELAEVNSQSGLPQPTREERQWTKFSDEWSKKKAERLAAGESGLSPDQKITKEAKRVVIQVEQLGKRLFGKNKKK